MSFLLNSQCNGFQMTADALKRHSSGNCHTSRELISWYFCCSEILPWVRGLVPMWQVRAPYPRTILWQLCSKGQHRDLRFSLQLRFWVLFFRDNYSLLFIHKYEMEVGLNAKRLRDLSCNACGNICRVLFS